MSTPDDPPPDEERRPYFSEVSPDERAPEDWRAVTGGQVLGGVLLGMIVTLVYYVFTLGTPGTSVGPLMFALAAVPAVVGVVLLLVPRTRRAMAGLVMGMAIGSIVFAGLCGTTFLGPM